MLHEKNFVEVGFIRKAHGFSGAMKVVFDEAYSGLMPDVEFVFLDVDGCKIPHGIAALDFNRDTIMKLTYIDDREKVLPFHQTPIYLLSEDIDEAAVEPDRRDQIRQLTGFMINVLGVGELGVIERIDEYPEQWMAVVKSRLGKEILIPLVEAFVVSIDSGTVTMDLPEGLI